MADVGMKDEHRKLLQKHRVILVRDLEPTRILNHLGEIFDNDDKDEISVCQTRVDKADKLLDLLPRKGPNAFECFVRTLKEKQKHLGDLLLKESGLSLSEQPNVDHGMSEQHRGILRRSTASLRDMNLEKLLLLMYCLDQEERDQILGIRTKSGRVDRLLLEVLPRKGPTAFENFVRVLDQFHPDFAKPLMKEAGMEPSQCPGRTGDLPYPVEHNETSYTDDVDKGIVLASQMAGLRLAVSSGSKTPRCLGDLGAQETLQIAKKIDYEDCSAFIANLQAELGCDGKGSTVELLRCCDDFPIRKFTQLLKAYQMTDIIQQLRKILPAGTTGPVLDESKNVRDMPFSVRRRLTQELCVDARWKYVAEQLGVDPSQMRFLECREKNPADEVLRFWEVKVQSTVGHLYDVLLKLDYPLIADYL